MVSERLPCALQAIDDDELGDVLCMRCRSGPCEQQYDEKKAEIIARAFHEAYERLAPTFSYSTRQASKQPWPDVPDNNKQLMIAVAHELLERGIIMEGWF